MRIPSKTFLLGEYAVLQGGPAMLVTHGPQFESDVQAKSPKPAFVSTAPAGLLAKKLGVDTHRIQFTDPFAAQGGFGRSSAEFLAVLASSKNKSGFTEKECWEARDLYISLAAGSGVDVLVQAFGCGEGPMLVGVDIRGKKLNPLPMPTLGVQLTLLHTGKKLPTHEHLKKAQPPDVESLAPIVIAGEAALKQKDKQKFAQALLDYGKVLAGAGLQADHSRDAVLGAMALPGVLAAKGCGAMGADVIAVVHETPISPDWCKAHSLAEVTQLKL